MGQAILGVIKIPKRFKKLGISLQISDHQQSVAQAPSRGLPHTPALLVVADYDKRSKRRLLLQTDRPDPRSTSNRLPWR